MSLRPFLRLPPDQDLRFADELIDNIDRILTIDRLDMYSVRFESLGGLEGLTDASAHEVWIAPEGTRKSLTLGHELGHVIDFSMNLSIFVLAGQTSDLNEFIWAVQESERVGDYEELRRHHPDPDVQAIAADLLQPAELWARSFAQYIAMRLPNTTIGNELDASLKMDPDTYILDYWDPLDFKPVGDAIGQVFHEWGWM